MLGISELWRNLVGPLSYDLCRCFVLGLAQVAIASTFFGGTTDVFGQMERAEPAQVGLDPDKLERLTDYLQREVQDGHIAGAVVALARHGRLAYFEAVGQSDLKTARPMQEDALFRIASMTKAVTCAAVMSLWEDGQLDLDDELSSHLPEFAGLKILRSVAGDSVATREALQPKIRDLLTHQSGLTYGWFGPDKLDEIYRKQGVAEFFTGTAETLEERVHRIAKLPLKFEPGTQWDYGVSTDVLGRVVEVVSGLSLEQFFYERFFRPLEMHDTHFYVPKAKQPRVASLYTIDESQQLIEVGTQVHSAGFLNFTNDYCYAPGTAFWGGSGLVASTGDYLRFLQMLLNEGELEGARVLKRETVRRMMSNHIGDLSIPFADHGDKYGFGFGVLTEAGRTDDVASVGTISWGGIFNTYYWVDPQEELVGVLMTQLFPYNHLDLRKQFKELAYESIDDSGFERSYWYEVGMERANPAFNSRQLRVNSEGASIHPRFSQRSEVRSSGLARIEIEEELRNIRRADLYAEIWGGHPGTRNKRCLVNGRKICSIPEVGTAQGHCTHQYLHCNLRPQDLVNGFNSLQFACDQGDSFWGHFIVDNIALRIGLKRDDQRISQLGLSEFDAMVIATPEPQAEQFHLQLHLPQERFWEFVEAVEFQASYFGFDENGDGQWSDWHGLSKDRVGEANAGTAVRAPFEVDWDTRFVPTQPRVRFRARVVFRADQDLAFLTKPSAEHKIEHPDGIEVAFCKSDDLPTPFWSRAEKVKRCNIILPFEPSEIEAAQLNVACWTGGAGNVRDYFTINGKPFPVAEGTGHEVVVSQLEVETQSLTSGANVVELISDTEHHGIEVLKPGPVLSVRYRRQESPVELDAAAIDKSAGNIACYRISTPNATYYLDKVGAGFSSIQDRDGNDWLGFHPRAGTGASGEYRGFPNAVFKEAGNYFHAKNASTDPCVTKVEFASPDRVVISATASNQKWAGFYTFNELGATFTLTKMPDDHRYWVLYEGVPGGSFDASDWWMTSAQSQKQALSATHEGDISGPHEWIAFGDQALQRSLVLVNHTDDDAPDRYYPMQSAMTVFGFGRQGMEKHLSDVPHSFSIAILETDDHTQVNEFVKQVIDQSTTSDGLAEGSVDLSVDPENIQKNQANSDPVAGEELRIAYQQFAMTHSGNAARGKQLFGQTKLQCAVCHRIGGKGGVVGPELTSVAGKLDRPHLIDSLLFPSRQIGYGYEQTRVLTEAGVLHSGIVKSEDEEGLVLVNAQGKSVEIPVESIEKKLTVANSLMPTGIEESLSQEEFVDLVAYLETLGPGKKFGGNVQGPLKLPEHFKASVVATGLSGATALDVAKDGRVLVCEQGGTLRMFEYGSLEKPAVAIPQPILSLPVEMNWERGLIGVTFAPDFPAEPFIYVVYVAQEPYTHHRVSRFEMNGERVVAGSEKILLRGDDQSRFGGNVPAGHQGGAIHFGPDGKLYVGIGEQTAKTPAQSLEALQGKILRINPDGSIPRDNPFFDKTQGKYRSIWALGCRNPFTFAFSADSGRMFINDVGGKYEEVNEGKPGANFGWPVVDHGPSREDRFVDPLHVYPQSSINGGDFCDKFVGWPSEYQGKYFFADFVHGWVKMIDPENPQDSTEFLSGVRRPVDLRFSSDGGLYVLLRNAWVVDDQFEGGTSSLIRIDYVKD